MRPLNKIILSQLKGFELIWYFWWMIFLASRLIFNEYLPTYQKFIHSFIHSINHSWCKWSIRLIVVYWQHFSVLQYRCHTWNSHFLRNCIRMRCSPVSCHRLWHSSTYLPLGDSIVYQLRQCYVICVGSQMRNVSWLKQLRYSRKIVHQTFVKIDYWVSNHRTESQLSTDVPFNFT